MGRKYIDNMSEEMKKDVIKVANYILTTLNSQESTAKALKMSKGRVQYYIYDLLPMINPKLYERLRKMISPNYKEMIKKAQKFNAFKSDRNRKNIEDELIKRIKEQGEIIVHIRDIAEFCGLKSKGSTRRYLKDVLTHEDGVLKLIAYDMTGFYKIRFRLDGEDSSMPKPSHECIDKVLSRKLISVSMNSNYRDMGERINDYILSRIKESGSNSVLIPSGELCTYLEVKSYDTVKRHLNWKLEEDSCLYTREIARSGKIYTNKFTLKK